MSDPTTLPHIVQLLLTFDPILVEKVSLLLYLVLDDNPKLPSLYLTGCFFFILMYTGSNILPIGRFLSMSHIRQAFRSEDKHSNDIGKKSILGIKKGWLSILIAMYWNVRMYSSVLLLP